MTGPTDRTPTCLVCGDPIDESAGETPVFVEGDLQAEIGDYAGDAYHLDGCEDGVFEGVYAEVGDGGENDG